MDTVPDITRTTSVQHSFPIEKRETGEGLESCDKMPEEFGYSSDSMADALLRETVSELEKALRDSKRLLSQRDAEINTLRSEIENVRRASRGGANECSTIEEEFKQSQIKIFELEKVIQQLQQDLTLCKRQTDKPTATPSDECTASSQACYCGSLCGAMKEAVELKRKLLLMEQKYHHLKRRFRHNDRNRVKVAHRDSSCTIS